MQQNTTAIRQSIKKIAWPSGQAIIVIILYQHWIRGILPWCYAIWLRNLDMYLPVSGNSISRRPFRNAIRVRGRPPAHWVPCHSHLYACTDMLRWQYVQRNYANSIRVSLKGRVTDEKSEPVSFCLIKVEGQAAATTANLEGKYSLSFNSADSVVITYKMMGYRPRRRVLYKPQGSLTLNIVMHDNFGMDSRTVLFKVRVSNINIPCVWR